MYTFIYLSTYMHTSSPISKCVYTYIYIYIYIVSLNSPHNHSCFFHCLYNIGRILKISINKHHKHQFVFTKFSILHQNTRLWICWFPNFVKTHVFKFSVFQNFQKYTNYTQVYNTSKTYTAIYTEYTSTESRPNIHSYTK